MHVIKSAPTNHHINLTVLNVMTILAYQFGLEAANTISILEPFYITKVNIVMLLAAV